MRLTILLLAAAPLAAQPTLRVTTSSSSLRMFDTIGVVAKPRDSLGRRVGSASMTWIASPSGVITIRTDSGSHGQRGTIAGVTRGASYAVASWKRSDRRTLRDSVLITVGPPAVVARAFFVRSYADSVTINTLARGLPFVGTAPCVYAVAYDKAGHVLTGRTVENMQARADLMEWRPVTPRSASCPDTTVDMARVP